MKKLIALVLALVMCFALCACGQSLPPQQRKLPQQNPQPTLQLTPQQSSTPR